MKFLDWVKKLGKREGAAARGEAKGIATASTDDEIPGWNRRVLLDERYLPKPPKKNYWEKPDPVLDADEARRAYSPSMRAKNEKLRALATDVELLKARSLPVWEDESEVAGALGMTVQKLRWLACHRYDDRLTHYYQYRVPKRSTGFRTIMAPKTTLKSAQRTLLEQLVQRLPVSDHAHGFVAGRSVATNARHHVGRRVVLHFDLEDFFGTVTFGRVRGYLIAMGYDYRVATSIALLATEAERQPVVVGDESEHDSGLRYVPIGHRACPQGAPTSPGLCNAIAMRLDRRLAGLAAANAFVYTRYADDLTFSGDDESKIGLFLRVVREIVEDEGFRLNRDKTHVMRSGGRQAVTGVVVNETLGLSRQERRKLRAQIHQMSPDHAPEELARLRGKLAYLRMLNPDQAAALRPDWL